MMCATTIAVKAQTAGWCQVVLRASRIGFVVVTEASFYNRRKNREALRPRDASVAVSGRRHSAASEKTRIHLGQMLAENTY
jgi:hypothetical protein